MDDTDPKSTIQGQNRNFFLSSGIPPIHPHSSPASASPDTDTRKSHRRSQSDSPFFGFPPPWGPPAKPEGRADVSSPAPAGDLLGEYMNLDSIDALSAKTANSSDTEAESGVSSTAVGTKRSHCRSVSVDSFIGGMRFGEEEIPGQHSRRGSAGSSDGVFSMGFGSGEFSEAELKKIGASEKLSEIAMVDPKRAKRILANRQSAARSKERKMRYISELEHKVQTLQTEATTVSAQLTMMQRDVAHLTTQNNEVKFRLQAMEQQAHLKDALNETLSAEVQRLKRIAGETQLANSLDHQMQLNPQIFQMQLLQKHKQQTSQIPHFQMQAEQQQRNADASKQVTTK